MLDYQAESLVSCAGDIRVHDYHDVDVRGGEVVMVAGQSDLFFYVRAPNKCAVCPS